MKACILAGGFGTRLKPLVSNVPKPLAPIKDRPFLEYLLDYWIEEGVDSFYLLTGYLGDLIEAHFKGCYRGCSVYCILEEKPLGTGGALKYAFSNLPDFDEGFVLNGDTFFEVNAKALMTFHQSKNADITLALRQVEKNDRYSGLLLSETGRVLEFMKREQEVKELLINGGVYFLNTRAVDALKSFPKDVASLEDEVFPNLLSTMGVYGLIQNQRFIDIGIPSDFEKAQHFFSPHVSH